MTKTQGVIVILLLVCLLVATTVNVIVDLTVGFMSGAGFYMSSIAMTQQPTLTASLVAPQTVKLGEEFDLVVKTKNTHEDEIRLHSIDIEYRFLNGFEVVSVSPDAVESSTGDSAYRTWKFSETVDPDESRNITLRLKAVQVGQFYGDLDVNNPNLDYETVFPIIRVVDKASGNSEDQR